MRSLSKTFYALNDLCAHNSRMHTTDPYDFHTPLAGPVSIGIAQTLSG